MTRVVFPVMGTVASIVVAPHESDRIGDECIADALLTARRDLELLDRRFSHFRADSEITRWLEGGPVSPDAIADFDHVLRACDRLKEQSDGVFRIKDPRTGRVDTAGYVKGFAIRRAARSLERSSIRDFVIAVGGDTYCGGRANADRPWRVAVADPMRVRCVAAVADATNLAVATSGIAERGDHIWNGRGAARGGLVSLTVVGPDIAEADAYATIGFAMGELGIAWVAERPGYHSMAITTDGTRLSDAALVSPV